MGPGGKGLGQQRRGATTKSTLQSMCGPQRAPSQRRLRPDRGPAQGGRSARSVAGRTKHPAAVGAAGASTLAALGGRPRARRERNFNVMALVAPSAEGGGLKYRKYTTTAAIPPSTTATAAPASSRGLSISCSMAGLQLCEIANKPPTLDQQAEQVVLESSPEFARASSSQLPTRTERPTRWPAAHTAAVADPRGRKLPPRRRSCPRGIACGARRLPRRRVVSPGQFRAAHSRARGRASGAGAGSPPHR